MVQCTREPAIGRIMTELLCFDGAEIYMKEWQGLVGMPFGKVLFAFDHAIPIGIKRYSTSSSRPHIFLNPPDDMDVQLGDEIVVLSEDEDTYHLKPSFAVPATGPPPPCDVKPRPPEKLLLLNWRQGLSHMITQLDEQVSEVIFCPCNFLGNLL